MLFSSTQNAVGSHSGPADVQREPEVQALRDEIVKILLRLGRACVPDMANQIPWPITPDEVLPVLRQMELDGVIKQVEKDAERNYEYPIYELA